MAFLKIPYWLPIHFRQFSAFIGKIQVKKKIQEKISPKLAREFKMGGGMVDKKSKFMGGGIAYKGGGRAMKRKGGKV